MVSTSFRHVPSSTSDPKPWSTVSAFFNPASTSNGSKVQHLCCKSAQPGWHSCHPSFGCRLGDPNFLEGLGMPYYPFNPAQRSSEPAHPRPTRKCFLDLMPDRMFTSRPPVSNGEGQDTLAQKWREHLCSDSDACSDKSHEHESDLCSDSSEPDLDHGTSRYGTMGDNQPHLPVLGKRKREHSTECNANVEDIMVLPNLGMSAPVPRKHRKMAGEFVSLAEQVEDDDAEQLDVEMAGKSVSGADQTENDDKEELDGMADFPREFLGALGL